MSIEIEHVVDGGYEDWINPTTPRFWTVVLTGASTVNQDTSEPVRGSSCLRCDRVDSTSLAYTAQVPRQPFIPGKWYRVRGFRFARKTDGTAITIGTHTRASTVLNLTRNTSLGPNGLFLSGLGQSWSPAPTPTPKEYDLWFQIPDTYGPSDSWEFRNGFTTAQTTLGFSFFDGMSIKGPYDRPLDQVGLGSAAVSIDTNPQVLITLISPSGIEYDLTPRTDIEDLGEITEGAEDELMSLTHGDLTLTLSDQDEFLSGLLEDAQPSDRWEVVFERETRKRRPKWERIFGGVLDLPWSIQRDPKEAKVELDVFSYSKLLERASAETVKRTFSGVTGSVSSGSSTVTLTTTVGLVIGDVIELTNAAGENGESHAIRYVLSSTQVKTVDTWSATKSAGSPCNLLTPFHRDRDPAFLVEQCAAAGGVTAVEVALMPSTTKPVPTPGQQAGVLGDAAFPASIVQSIGQIQLRMTVGATTTRYDSATPREPYASNGTVTTIQGDWSPYLSTEPGSILTRSIAGPPAVSADDGSTAWNYQGTKWYRLQIDNTGGSNYAVRIYDETGVNVQQLQTFSWAGAGLPVFFYRWLEHIPGVDEVWAAYQVVDDTDGSAILDAGKFWDIGVGNGNLPITARGRFRYSVMTDRVYSVHDRSPFGSVHPKDWVLREWNPATRTQTRSVQLPQRTPFLWAARVIAGFLIVPFEVAFSGGVYLIDLSNFSLEEISELFPTDTTASAPHRVAISCAFSDAERGETVLVIAAFQSWVVFGRSYAGVIPYADFDGLGVAAALKELAIATVSLFASDVYGGIAFRSRLSIPANPTDWPIEDPIEQTSRPIWEQYRTAVLVTGETSAGVKIEELVGDASHSARRLDVSLRFATTVPFARSIGQFMVTVFGVKRRQEDIRIREAIELVKTLDTVIFDGRRFVAQEVTTNIVDREQGLRLFEVP